MSAAGKPQNKASASADKKIIFQASEVADHLESVKSAAAAARDADDDSPLVWWAGVLDFEWASARKGGSNGTQWANITYRSNRGVSARLFLRINGETHIGQINPLTDEGVAELTAQSKNPKVQIKKRDRKPTLQFQRWRGQVKTADDGITLLADEEGNPIVPGDDARSDYFRVAFLVNEAFIHEANERIDRGMSFVDAVVESKKKNKAATAQSIVDAFAASNGARRPGDMILSTSNIDTIRRQFPDPKNQEILTKGAIVVSMTKVASLVQEFISNQALKNAGMPLPNPMTRIAMNFDATTGLPVLSIFDKSTKFIGAGGKPQFEGGKVNGEPVNADNIHKFILSRSTIDGIVNMDSVCFSSMGISIPVKAEVIVVTKPTVHDVSIDDVYGDDFYGDDDTAAAATPRHLVESAAADEQTVEEPPVVTKPAATKPAAPVAAKPAAPVAATKPAAPAAPAAAKPVTKAAAPVAKATAAKPAAAKVAPKPAPVVETPVDEANYDELLDELGSAE
jgi:hypothetical protein